MSKSAVLYVVVGLPGAGKTAHARGLEAQNRALRFTPDEWMIPLFGEPEADGKRDILEGRLIWLAYNALLLGVNAVLDFGVWSKDERTALRSLAYSAGAKCELHYLAIDEQTQLERIRDRVGLVPHETFEATDLEPADTALAAARAIFQPPDATEVGKTNLDAPPTGFGSWAQWAAARWPSLPVI